VVETPPKTFFPTDSTLTTDIIPSQTQHASDAFWGPNHQLADEYSTHRAPFLGVGSPEKILCVDPNPSQSHLSGEVVHWPSLLSTGNQTGHNNHFVYYDTLYSNLEGDLVHCEAPITDAYLNSNRSPYSEFTRAIHIFKPTSGHVDNLVFLNDGVAYLLTGAMTQFESMADKGTLSPHTAFVFVNPLPGLLKTIDATDPKAAMPGMGERTIDFEHGIDQYAGFIADKLYPALNTKAFKLPDSSHRIMVGSSLSGTASIYIALKYPALFGCVMAQSPSPSNRSILSHMVKTYDASTPHSDIVMSAGEFEQLGYAENTNLFYARELSKKLHIPLEENAHGHQFLAWIAEFEQSLPHALQQEEAVAPPSQAAQSSTQDFKDSLSKLKSRSEEESPADNLTPLPNTPNKTK
jgi:enterochelin esterase-like enzyme